MAPSFSIPSSLHPPKQHTQFHPLSFTSPNQPKPSKTQHKPKPSKTKSPKKHKTKRKTQKKNGPGAAERRRKGWSGSAGLRSSELILGALLPSGNLQRFFGRFSFLILPKTAFLGIFDSFPKSTDQSGFFWRYRTSLRAILLYFYELTYSPCMVIGCLMTVIFLSQQHLHKYNKTGEIHLFPSPLCLFMPLPSLLPGTSPAASSDASLLPSLFFLAPPLLPGPHIRPIRPRRSTV